MEKIKGSLVRSSGWGPFLLVFASVAVLNDIYSYSSSSMYLLIYVST